MIPISTEHNLSAFAGSIQNKIALFKYSDIHILIRQQYMFSLEHNASHSSYRQLIIRMTVFEINGMQVTLVTVTILIDVMHGFQNTVFVC